jgi:hypothetical protein
MRGAAHLFHYSDMVELVSLREDHANERASRIPAGSK